MKKTEVTVHLYKDGTFDGTFVISLTDTHTLKLAHAHRHTQTH